MIELFEYQLPFVKPFRTARADITYRIGVLIRYTDSRCEIITEAAPLPGFSPNHIDRVRSELLQHRLQLEHFLSTTFDPSKFRDFLKTLPDSPSIQFAVSFLGIQLLINKYKYSIEDIFDRTLHKTVPVNEIISIDRPEEVKSDFETACNNGFTTFKFKAGYPLQNLDILLDDLNQGADVNNLRFRLDANQSWPSDQLSEIMPPFYGLPIEYIEEPSSWETVPHLKNIMDQSAIPLALDESVNSLEKLNTFLQQFPGIVFIIKPTILGNLFDIFETIHRSRSRFSDIVVTTSLESRIGRSMTATAAALMGDPNRAHGLHTGRYLEHDLLPDFHFASGQISVPETGYWNHKLSDIDPSFIHKIE